MKKFRLNMLFYQNELYKYDLKMKLTILFMVVSLFKIQASNAIEDVTKIISNNSDITLQQSVSGTITDSNGLPLAGATIIIKGTSTGTTTDFDGNYTLAVSEDAVLVVSYIGYVTQEISIDGRSSIDIVMQEDASQLDEVVLVGYGKQKAKDVTGSVKLITAEDFNGGVTNSPGQLIQGKIAGVNVTSNTGEPGSAISINIRGVNSIGTGSDPLFVVDGIPLDGGDSPGSGFGELSATRQSPLNFLNPSDIKSMTVLKDASATAIYGTRGANGVILIETFKGKAGQKSTLSYDTYLSTSEVANKIDVLDTPEFLRQLDRLGVTDTGDPNINTDWQDVVFRSAITQNHKLSFSGGNDKTTFYASLGYLDQEGLIKTTGLEKVTEHLSITTSVLNDIIKLEASITASQSQNESQATGGRASSVGNLLTSVVRASPTTAPFDENGILTGEASSNPVIYLETFRDHSEIKTFLANLSVSTDLSFITEGLNHKLSVGVQSSDSDRAIRVIPPSAGGGDITDFLGANTFETTNKLIENYLNYNRTFGNFTINALLGTSYQEFENKGVIIQREGLTTKDIDPIYNFGVASKEILTLSFINERKLQSYFGRINVNLSDKYLFTTSLRADGSSVFGRNNRYGYFPSAAFGWNITNESFMDDSKLFYNLKLRLGWGQTGNQAVPVKVTQGSFASDRLAGYNFGPGLTDGIIVARTPNPDLKWETTTQTNIGLDWSILDGKVSGILDYFSKKTKDLFLEVAAQTPAIVSTVFINSDTEIENTGFEFALNAQILKTGNLGLDFGGNIAFLDNKIKNLDADIEVGKVTGPGASNETSSIYRTGESAGAFFLKRFLGFDPDTGAELLSDEKEIVGDGLPDVTYGFYVAANYKNWDLSLNFNGVSGVDIFNNTARAFSSAQALKSNKENVIAKFLDLEESGNFGIETSSRYLENGSFLRLNNASIGYNFDASNIDWLGKFRVYLSGQNLFIITDYTGYDPEVNTQGGNVYGVDFGAYPSARTILLGLNITIN